jgi:hypothetical protein
MKFGTILFATLCERILNMSIPKQRKWYRVEKRQETKKGKNVDMDFHTTKWYRYFQCGKNLKGHACISRWYHNLRTQLASIRCWFVHPSIRMLVCPTQHRDAGLTDSAPNQEKGLHVRYNTTQCKAWDVLGKLFFPFARQTTIPDLLLPPELHGYLDLTENCEWITKKYMFCSCKKTT